MKEVKIKDITTFSDVIELHSCMSSLKLNSKDEAEFLRLVSQCSLFEKLKKYCKETIGYKYDIY